MNEQHILDIYNLEQTIGKLNRDRHNCLNLLETALSAMNNPKGLSEIRTQIVRDRIEVCLDILNTHHTTI